MLRTRRIVSAWFRGPLCFRMVWKKKFLVWNVFWPEQVRHLTDSDKNQCVRILRTRRIDWAWFRGRLCFRTCNKNKRNFFQQSHGQNRSHSWQISMPTSALRSHNHTRDADRLIGGWHGRYLEICVENKFGQIWVHNGWISMPFGAFRSHKGRRSTYEWLAW